MTVSSRFVFAISVSTIALALVACASRPPPPPFSGPAVDLATTHFPGTPLSGPVAASPADGALDAVTVRVLALEVLPEDLLGAVSAATDLIVAPPDAETLLPAGRLSRGTRYSPRAEDRAEFDRRRESGDLGRVSEIGDARGAVGPGITSRFAITAREARLHPERPERHRPRLTLLLRGEGEAVAAGPVRLAVVLDGLLAEEAEADEPVALMTDSDAEEKKATPPRRQVVREETILLRSDGEGGRHELLLIFPTPFDPSGGAAVAVLVDVLPPPDPDTPEADAHVKAVALCREQVSSAAARAKTERDRGVPPSAVWPGLGGALGAGDSPPPRRTIAFLANTTGAPFAEDVSLSVDDERVAALGEAVFAALRDAAAWPEKDALAWLLEREAYRLVVEESLGAGTSPSLEALLVRHLGEVGRNPALIEEMLLQSADVPTFAENVRQENLIFLEDNAPAARLRAFDWLALRGHAPEGYRPLAPRKERRKALRRALDGEER